MQRKIYLLIVLCLYLSLTPLSAQELPPFEGEFEVITAENASQLQEVAVLGAPASGQIPWWSEDGQSFYFRTRDQMVWEYDLNDLAHPEYVTLEDVPQPPNTIYPDEINFETPITTSPDSRYEVFYELTSRETQEALLHIIDTLTDEEVRAIPAYYIGFRSLSGQPFVPQFTTYGLYYFSPPTSEIPSGTFHRWNPITNIDEVLSTTYLPDVYLNPEGSLGIVSNVVPPGQLSVWEFTTTPYTVLYDHTFQTTDRWESVALSPNEAIIATGGNNANVRFWDIPSRGMDFIDSEEPNEYGEQGIVDLAYSPDGNYIAGVVNTISAGFALILDAHTGEELVRISGITTNTGYTFFSGLGIHPDGGLIFFGGADGTLRGWRMETLLQSSETSVDEATYILRVHDEAIVDISFNPQGTRYVTASWDDTVTLWDFPSLQPIATFTGHTDDVWSAVISPINPDLIATASDDNTIRLWNAATGQSSILPVDADRVGPSIRDLRFSSDGSVLFGVDYSGDILVWDVNQRELLTVITQEYYETTWHLDLSADGKLLVTAGDAGMVRLFGIPVE